MNCMIDIKKEGNSFIAYLPFNPRNEFGILKGSILVKCTIGGVGFKSKLMPRGNERYCLFFSRLLLKKLGLNEGEHLNVQLSIEPDCEDKSQIAEPEILVNETLSTIRARASIRKENQQSGIGYSFKCRALCAVCSK